jgi:hypothetical protein
VSEDSSFFLPQLETAEKRIKELELQLSELRVLLMAGGCEPHWLTKDFNVLYAAAFAFSETCLGRGDGTPYGPHLELQAQLERLAPAFQDTEEMRAILRKRGET